MLAGAGTVILTGSAFAFPASTVAVVVVMIAFGFLAFVETNRHKRPKNYEELEQNSFHYIDDEELVGDRQAVEADRYGDNFAEDALSYGEKQAKARQYHEQKAESNSIKITKTGLSNQKWENLKRKFRKSGDNDPQKPQLNSEDEIELKRWVYEEVSLPSEKFNYTSVVAMNHVRQGTLHSFARHSDQWLSMIPDLDLLMSQLPSRVYNKLHAIQSVLPRDAHYGNMKRLYENLEKEIRSGTDEFEIRAVLFKIQVKILDFLRKSVQGEFIGMFVYEGGIRLLFRVTDPQGNRSVMALAVSRQLDRMPGNFNNRPFRSIITVFFMSEAEVEECAIKAKDLPGRK